jgi:hypothetical protein
MVLPFRDAGGIVTRASGVFFAVIVLAMTLTACGGGGISTTAPAPLSDVQVVKVGNAICAKAEQDRLSAFKEAMYTVAGDEMSVSEQEHLLPKALDPYLEAAKKMEGLDTTAAQSKKISAVTVAMKAAYQNAQKDPRAAVTSDSQVFGKANALAIKYGLRKCVL